MYILTDFGDINVAATQGFNTTPCSDNLQVVIINKVANNGHHWKHLQPPVDFVFQISFFNHDIYRLLINITGAKAKKRNAHSWRYTADILPTDKP